MTPERGPNMEAIAAQEAVERLPVGFKLAEVPKEWGPPQVHKVGSDSREVLGYKMMDRGQEVVVESLEVIDETKEEQSQALPARQFRLKKGDRIVRWYGVKPEGPNKGKSFLTESVTQHEDEQRKKETHLFLTEGDSNVHSLETQHVLIPAHFCTRPGSDFGFQESRSVRTQRISSDLDRETGNPKGLSFERRNFLDKEGRSLRQLDRSIKDDGTPGEDSEDRYYSDRYGTIRVDESGDPVSVVSHSDANFLDFLARRGYGGNTSFVDLESGRSWQETTHHLTAAEGRPLRLLESSDNQDQAMNIGRRRKEGKTLSPDELKKLIKQIRETIKNLEAQIVY